MDSALRYSRVLKYIFVSYLIKFLLILFAEHPFTFIKLFIAVTFTGRY